MAHNRINKKNKVVKRFRNRQSAQASIGQKDLDMALIDLVLKKLYNNGDKQTASLTDDVLKPNNINYTESGSDRLWDILISTGLVSPIVGFGRSGRLALTNDGYQLMNAFGSYSNFITQREKQAQAQTNPGVVAPQFILTKGKEQPEEEENKALQTGKGDQAAAAEQNFTK